MNLVLVGLMGSGKSTVGRQLAERLGRSFIDTDAVVADRAGRTIAEIFQTDGEAAFRHMESQIIAEVTSAGGAVIATGGGAVLSAENRALMRQDSLVVWLQAPKG
jgi:shikimate kinase